MKGIRSMPHAHAILGVLFLVFLSACGGGGDPTTSGTTAPTTQTFSLTVNKAGTGTGTITSNSTGINCGADCQEDYNLATLVTLTATPDEGSTFASWSDACTGTGPCAVTMDAAKSVMATFSLKTFTVTPSAGTNGTITPSAPQTVNYNQTTSFTITPDTGYHIADILVDGVSAGALAIASGGYTFANVTTDHTISASFAINTYNITASAGANGTISPSGSVLVNYGSGQTFTITANTGYHIADVLVDSVSLGPVTTFTFTNVTANHTISASFAIDTASSAPLVGTWGVGQLRHKNDGTWLSVIIKATYNSDGTGSRTIQENNNGTIQSRSDTFTYTWSSNSDGSLTVTMNFADGSTSTGRRVISDDGKVMIWDWTDQSDNQRLSVAVKLDTTKTYTSADLQGDYYALRYRYKSSDGTYRGLSGISSFDGSGSRSTSGTVNENGTLSTFSNTKTYSVNSDGKYSIDSDPNGYLLGNGIMGISSHVITSDVWSIGGLLKKQDKTYSTADLEGTWAFAGFGDHQGTTFYAEFGSITCDNSGNCTANIKIRNSDGSVSYITDTSSISVASDGSFGGSLAVGAPSYAGAIGNNGNTLIVNMSFDQADLNNRFIGVAVRCSSCSNLAFSVGPITFADYLPLLSGTNTFQWTYGPNTGTQYTNTIGGTETVPYTSGSLTGSKIYDYDGLEGDPLDYFVVLNDGTNVKFLADEDSYVSTDCSLTAPSEEWSFSIIYDGMIIKQDPFYVVNKTNPADCISEGSDQSLLFDIQNVTVQGTSYQNAVIWWYLDLNYTFKTLNFNGRDSDLGITLPTSSDTGGYAVTAFEIYGLDTGSIASGDVDAASGNLLDLSERVSK